MANQALAILEKALRARKLDRTLTTAIPPGKGDGRVAPTALAGLDAGLYPTAQACATGASGEGGGLPRGQLSEMAGPRSSGRTTLLLQMLAAATRRGEITALVDTFDRLDLASVVAAGVDLDRLLWIRGHAVARSQGPGLGPQSGAWAAGLSLRPEALVDRTIDRALKALNLVLQAGGFGVVALDLADASPAAFVNGNRKPHICGNRKLHTPGEDVSGGADILPVMPVGRVGLDAGSGATGVLANTRREAAEPAVTLRLPHAVRPTLSSASADAPASGSCCPGC